MSKIPTDPGAGNLQVHLCSALVADQKGAKPHTWVIRTGGDCYIGTTCMLLIGFSLRVKKIKEKKKKDILLMRQARPSEKIFC